MISRNIDLDYEMYLFALSEINRLIDTFEKNSSDPRCTNLYNIRDYTQSLFAETLEKRDREKYRKSISEKLKLMEIEIEKMRICLGIKI